MVDPELDGPAEHRDRGLAVARLPRVERPGPGEPHRAEAQPVDRPVTELPGPGSGAGSALNGTAPLGGQGDRGVASGAGLLLGQGPVGSAEPQRERQRLVAGADLVAGVDVEEPDRLEESPAPSRSAASTSAAVTSSATTRATSSLATGKVENWGPGTTSTACGHQDVEVDLDRGRAGRQPERRARLRVQLAGVTELDAVHEDRAQRPGCQGIRLAETTSTSTPSSRRAGGPGRSRPTSPRCGPAPHQPARSRSPASTTARCSG